MYRHDFMKTRADEDYITGAEARNAYEDKDYQLLPGGSMQLMAGFTFDATTGPGAFEVRTTNGDELFGASQYELTDHLGNVRIGLVDEEGSAITFDATMEADKAEEESQYFMNTDTRHMDPMFNHTAAGAYSSRLNPYLEGGSAIGPAIYLEVSPGDTVAMEVFARYTAQVSDANNVVPALASAIAAGFGGQSPINEAVTLGEAFTEALAAGAAVPTDAGSTAPKAYLQYILFNKNMSMAQHGHHMVSEEAGSSWQHLQLRVPIEEIGYIYIYVINESMDGVDVYFDDLEVQLIDAPLTSASDYYPYGLPISYRSHSSEHYRYGYQGQFAEKDEETGWNAFELRMYEPVIGRWIVPDPMRQYFSPYLAFGNNPISSVDPDGGNDLNAKQAKVLTNVFYKAIIQSTILKAQFSADNHHKDHYELGDIEGVTVEGFNYYPGKFAAVMSKNMYDGNIVFQIAGKELEARFWFNNSPVGNDIYDVTFLGLSSDGNTESGHYVLFTGYGNRLLGKMVFEDKQSFDYFSDVFSSYQNFLKIEFLKSDHSEAFAKKVRSYMIETYGSKFSSELPEMEFIKLKE
jgi:RHS repeat-associated protein